MNQKGNLVSEVYPDGTNMLDVDIIIQEKTTMADIDIGQLVLIMTNVIVW